jgi:RecA/RadA recombinase
MLPASRFGWANELPADPGTAKMTAAEKLASMRDGSRDGHRQADLPTMVAEFYQYNPPEKARAIAQNWGKTCGPPPLTEEEVDACCDRHERWRNGKFVADAPSPPSFSAYIERVLAPKSKSLYRKTGLASLDAGLNGGLVPGQLVIINGLPSVGKTNLEDHLAVAFARAGLRTNFAEGEMSHDEIYARLCAAQAGLAVTKIEDSLYGEYALHPQFEGMRLINAGRELDRLPLKIHGRVKTVAALRTLLIEQPCDVLIVGVLQRFQPPEGMERGRHAVESDINALKDLAMEFNVIVIAASHVQRPIRTKNDGERQPIFYPTKESARESGQIEGLADVMILLARDMASESAIERQKLYWRVAKVRRGRDMPRFLYWTVNPVTLKIRDTDEACTAMKAQRAEDDKQAKEEEQEP